jgi:hypothetical protein
VQCGMEVVELEDRWGEERSSARLADCSARMVKREAAD